MIASVHIADVGVGKALGVLRGAPKPAAVPGLRHADVGAAAPLSSRLLGTPQPGRVALLAYWDDDDVLDQFEAESPVAQRLAGGWHARLRPLRMYGGWPGMPDDTPSGRSVDHEGPAVVFTLGRLRISQSIRFLKTSAKAEAAALEAPGLLWATGLTRPPLLATVSVWESSATLSTYAFGRRDPSHPDAIGASEKKAFHKQQAFIRFAPYQASGSLDGRNPLAPTTFK